jgi:hypothetical protein
MPYITVGAGEISVERGRNAEQLAARGQRDSLTINRHPEVGAAERRVAGRLRSSYRAAALGCCGACGSGGCRAVGQLHSCSERGEGRSNFRTAAGVNFAGRVATSCVRLL